MQITQSKEVDFYKEHIIGQSYLLVLANTIKQAGVVRLEKWHKFMPDTCDMFF